MKIVKSSTVILFMKIVKSSTVMLLMKIIKSSTVILLKDFGGTSSPSPWIRRYIVSGKKTKTQISKSAKGEEGASNVTINCWWWEGVTFPLTPLWIHNCVHRENSEHHKLCSILFFASNEQYDQIRPWVPYSLSRHHCLRTWYWGGGEAKYILYSKVLLQKPLPQSRMSEWPINSFLSGSETVDNLPKFLLEILHSILRQSWSKLLKHLTIKQLRNN